MASILHKLANLTVAAFITLISVEATLADIQRPAPVHQEATYHQRAKVWVLNQNGHQIVWYNDGTRKAEGDFERSQRYGVWKFYYPDGDLKASGAFRSNLRHGEWKLYYDNGQLEAKGRYIKNKKDGPWITYHKNGNVESKGDYDQGQKEGVWKNYYESGQLFYSGHYKNNMAHGSWTFFFKNGSPYQAGDYHKDVRTGKWKICVFARGPCETEYFELSDSPKTADLPPPEQDTPSYDPSNPAGLLESLDKGGVPEEVPPSLRDENSGW